MCLGGPHTPHRLSCLCWLSHSMLAFISPYSAAAGLLSHTIAPEIFIKVSLLSRQLGIHNRRVYSHRHKGCSSRLTHLSFQHKVEKIISFSAHPSSSQSDLSTDARPCVIAGVPPQYLGQQGGLVRASFNSMTWF